MLQAPPGTPAPADPAPTSLPPGGVDARAAAAARRLRRWARIVLVPVAVIGAVLSFRSLYLAAEPVFGPQLASGFPLLVDALILGASLQYVAGAKVGRARAGWRLTAHAGVAGTLVLNALAARTSAEVPWHVTAPAVWSVLVELTAREVLGEWKATHRPPADRIPARLWLTAPVESVRTWLRLARRVEGEQATARLEVGLHAAAVEALRLALPGLGSRRARRILTRQLRAGSLPPAAVLAPLGWTDEADALTTVTPAAVLRAALRETLLRSITPDPTAVSEAEPGDGDSHPHVNHPHVNHAGDGHSGDSHTVEDTMADTTGADTRVAATRRPAMTPTGRATDDSGPADTTRPAATANGTGNGARPDRTPVPAVEPDQQPGGAPPSPGRPTRSSGDRQTDAATLLQADPTLTGPQLAAQLRGLGWDISDRTGARDLQRALPHLHTRLTAVP